MSTATTSGPTTELHCVWMNWAGDGIELAGAVDDTVLIDNDALYIALLSDAEERVGARNVRPARLQIPAQAITDAFAVARTDLRGVAADVYLIFERANDGEEPWCVEAVDDMTVAANDEALPAAIARAESRSGAENVRVLQLSVDMPAIHALFTAPTFTASIA